MTDKCFDCDDGPCYMNCGPVVKVSEDDKIRRTAIGILRAKQPLSRSFREELANLLEEIRD